MAVNLKRKSVLCCVVSLCLLTTDVFGYAAEELPGKATENELKTAFIYHLFSFTTWPATYPESASWRICIWPDVSEASDIQRLNHEEVAGKPITVSQCPDGQCDPGCHILLLPDGRNEAVTAYLHGLHHSPVLTIANAGSELANESLMHFYRDKRQLHLEIDYQATQKTGIQMSARLLRLMRIQTFKGVYE